MPGSMVDFASNGGRSSGYLAVPAGGSGPGVVVIQEWWGLVAHIKDVADRFAAEGFLALAPDLYHGVEAKSPDEAGKLMMALNIAAAEREISGAVAYLAAHGSNATRRVGTIGFCMGGALSLYAASTNPGVGACVVFYGGHPGVRPDLPSLAAPVLGLYAEKDGFVTAAMVRQLDAELTALGKEHELRVYPGAQHAFFNDARPEVYDAAAAADAWARTLEFLRRHLG